MKIRKELINAFRKEEEKMQHQIKYNEETDIIEVEIKGRRDVYATLDILGDSVLTARKAGIKKYFFDYRQTFGNFGTGSFKKMIRNLEEFGLSKNDKVAIVSNYDSIDLDVLTTILNIKGWNNINCFKDKENAIDWLRSLEIKSS